MKLIKKTLRYIFGVFGYEIQKKNLSDNFEILNKLQKKKDLIIFDIGANTGRWIDNSIQRFNIENIHAFEPSKNEFKLLKEKYSNEKK